MRIVFACGGERTGKSVLTKTFESKGWTYFHFDPPKGSPYKEYRGFLDSVLKNPANADKNFIIDRYMYCEFPYSKHFGRSTDMTVGKMHEIERGILALDPAACVIYCENDIDVNWELICAEGKREFRSREEVLKLRDDYRKILNQTMLTRIDYDFTSGTEPEDIYEKVVSMR